MKELIEGLKSTFSISDVTYQKSDLAFVTIPKDEAVMLITHLRDYKGYSHLLLWIIWRKIFFN